VHPAHSPFDRGRLDRPDGTRLSWEASGSPTGTPAVYLHGGPGSTLQDGSYRRWFDPDRYLVVGLDQRGCGGSTPSVLDGHHALDTVTTAAMIDDLEALREHLGIDRWVVTGISWGCTLALAYAQEHPDRVLRLVLLAVTTTSREEVDWITEGVGRFFPDEWEQFAAASQRRPGERVVEAYRRLLRDPSSTVREAAADAWDRWESTHIRLDPAWTPGPHVVDPVRRRAFATLTTHVWAQDAFLPGDRAVLARMDRLAHVPGVLVHGRRDISSPVVTAWRLHRAWPASTLHVVEDEGHGGPRSTTVVVAALDDAPPA
jgi:proline iminopeptidase